MFTFMNTIKFKIWDRTYRIHLKCVRVRIYLKCVRRVASRVLVSPIVSIREVTTMCAVPRAS
jgi:hypothetical protein